ncbi:MAG: hydrolase TatD [Desulfobacterales bacterium CG23_combo_of_CG06-09_8_20_14_all_51_8]|nr:MAG: hydrolase TatD [Desulfobacterales bacterium CG23_combo_of_CG06-09_8_20_14_all_51_8]
MKIFDSHCHLNDTAYTRDLLPVIDRAKAAHVDAMMIVGITEPTSNRAIDIADAHPGCFASMGVHPHDAAECNEAMLSRLKKLTAHPKVKAWGETGLDFNRMYSPKEIQEKWFVRQLETADDLNLPLIFHERDSAGRFLEILTAHYAGSGCRGVVHCFSGDRRELNAYIKLGLHIGVTGIVTIESRGQDLRNLIPHIPVDRILVETDAPYLTPAPEKNKTRRNEPAFVRSVLMKVAAVLQLDPEALADITWRTTCQLFNVNSDN